jgi:hypothetical protein
VLLKLAWMNAIPAVTFFFLDVLATFDMVLEIPY